LRETAWSEDPDRPRVVFVNPGDVVVWEPMLCGESGENTIAVTNHAAVFRAHPQITLPVFPESPVGKPVTGQARCIGPVENLEAHTIKTDETVKSG